MRKCTNQNTCPQYAVLPLLLLCSSLLAGCATSANLGNPNPPVQGNLSSGRPTTDLAAQPAGRPPHADPETLDWADAQPPANPSGQSVQIGRYRSLQALPTEAQKNILQVIIQMTFPEELTTLKSAIGYLLAKSGYEFALPVNKSGAVATLLSKPLPAVHRHLGPMTLQSALETIAGPHYRLRIDSIHRRLGYELLPAAVAAG